MTNKEIYNIAMCQSAVDSNCNADDFLAFENKIVISNKNPDARKYLELPFYCDLTSYGNNIVASVSEELFEVTKDYLYKFPIEHCFETPNLNVLIEKLQPFDMGVCFMAEYFLPDVSVIAPFNCRYEIKIMGPDDFADYYLPQWSNALCEKRKLLDKLAVGAYDHGNLVGLAGCSADCDTMWQIGVDVSSNYRKQGIASCLTNKLVLEVLKMNIVPFYCCAWSNIKSVKNAIKSGLKPAWVQVTVKTNEFIATMNK